MPLPALTVEELRPHVQVTVPEPGLMAFLQSFNGLSGCCVTWTPAGRIAYENIEDAHDEGLDYVELRFSPWFMAMAHGLDPRGVTEAVIEGVNDGRAAFGVKAELIGILSRTFGEEICWKELDALLACRSDLIAIDLAGDEGGFPAKLFKNISPRCVTPACT